MGASSDLPFEIVRLERLDPTTRAVITRIGERARVHDGHSPIGEHKFIRLVEGEPDTFGLVARVGETPAGYAQATRYPAHGPLPRRLAAEVLVDPDHRGRGIGSALVDRLLASARDHGSARFDIWAHHADAASAGLATSYRMHVTRQLWQMATRLGQPAAHGLAPAPRAEVRIRSFRTGIDERILIGLIRETFSEHPENAAFDAEDLAARAALPWFDPAAILIAEDAAGMPIGMHWMKHDAERQIGEVYILAVSPAAQGHGLGEMLLRAGLQQMRDRGIGLAILYVDAENDAAIALYRKAGFRFEHLDTCYSVDLTEGVERTE